MFLINIFYYVLNTPLIFDEPALLLAQMVSDHADLYDLFPESPYRGFLYTEFPAKGRKGRHHGDPVFAINRVYKKI
jgi:hypothetical protein